MPVIVEEEWRLKGIALGCYKRAKNKHDDFAEEAEFEQCIKDKLEEMRDSPEREEFVNENIADKLIDLFGVNRNGAIYVGGLGDSILGGKSDIEATLVIEEDGTVSWQLLPDEHSDIGVITLPVKPLNADEHIELLKSHIKEGDK